MSLFLATVLRFDSPYDYQQLCGKGARTPPKPPKGTNGDQTRESGGNFLSPTPTSSRYKTKLLFKINLSFSGPGPSLCPGHISRRKRSISFEIFRNRSKILPIKIFTFYNEFLWVREWEFSEGQVLSQLSMSSSYLDAIEQPVCIFSANSSTNNYVLVFTLYITLLYLISYSLFAYYYV